MTHDVIRDRQGVVFIPWPVLAPTQTRGVMEITPFTSLVTLLSCHPLVVTARRSLWKVTVLPIVSPFLFLLALPLLVSTPPVLF